MNLRIMVDCRYRSTLRRNLKASRRRTGRGCVRRAHPRMHVSSTCAHCEVNMYSSHPSRKTSTMLPSQWLALALVIEKSSHAYELGTRYEQRFASFAPTGPSAIYKSLERLRRHDFVTSAPRNGGGRSAQAVYTATLDGTDAHRQWLVSRVRPQYWRVEMLARIATGATLGRDGLLKLIDKYEKMASAHEETIEALPAGAGSDRQLRLLVRRLVAQEQKAITTVQLDWAKHASQQLRPNRS